MFLNLSLSGIIRTILAIVIIAFLIMATMRMMNLG